MSGSKLGVINPDEKLFSSAEERRTGKIWDLSKKKENQVYAAHNESPMYKSVLCTDIEKGHCHGTLFRFNFRKEFSKLSKTVYTHKKIIELFDSFKQEGHLALIFMKNLEKIEFYVREKGQHDAKLVRSFSVEASSLPDLRRKKREFMQQLKTRNNQSCFSQELIFEASISTKETNTMETTVFDYSVIHYYAGNALADENNLIKAEEANELGFIPLVGMAYPKERDLHTGGHIFCALPLPLLGTATTGLPVHVNGFFALGPDRKDLKWSSLSAECSDKQILWNQFLISIVLPVAYLKLFRQLKLTGLSTDKVYGSFPDTRVVDVKWKQLAISFYNKLLDIDCVWTNAKTGK